MYYVHNITFSWFWFAYILFFGFSLVVGGRHVGEGRVRSAHLSKVPLPFPPSPSCDDAGAKDLVLLCAIPSQDKIRVFVSVVNGRYFLGLAQAMFPLWHMWHGVEHEELQGLQQGALLRSVCLSFARIFCPMYFLFIFTYIYTHACV